MKKAILFDLDGVIIDSEALHHRAEEIVMSRNGYKWDKPDESASTGRPFKEALAEIIDDKKIILKLLEEKKEYFFSHTDEIRVIEPTKRFIIENASRFKYAVVTSSYREYAYEFLDRFGLTEFFDVIITSDDVKNHKPHPEPFMKAAELLCIDVKHCVAIEDSILGLQSIKDAGIFSIGLTGTFPRSKLVADLVVDEISTENLGDALS